MYAQTYLQRRGAIYQFRRRIPRDLAGVIGRAEIRCSLRTADRRAADRIVRARAAELDRQWEGLRRNGTSKDASPDRPFALPPSADFLTINTSPGTRPSSAFASVANEPKRHRTLKDALAVWRRLSSPAASSVEVYEAAVRRFEESQGALGLDEIRRSHLRDFIDELQQESLRPRTIRKEFGVIRVLLAIAEDQEWISGNPARSMRLPKVQQKKVKRSYAIEEVKRIFGSSVFSQGERPVAGKGECAVWIPLLLLYRTPRHYGERR